MILVPIMSEQNICWSDQLTGKICTSPYLSKIRDAPTPTPHLHISPLMYISPHGSKGRLDIDQYQNHQFSTVLNSA